MRKFYSIVLMAAALLVGTNVKAVEVSDWAGLSSALATASEITLTGDISMSGANQILISGNKVLTLNLNGHNIAYEGDATYYPIQLDGGTLTINGAGTISSNFYAVIKVVGSYDNVANYSVLNVANGVNMTSDGEYAFVVAQAKVPSTTTNSTHGYGIVINFNGYVEAKASEGTAFWVLGNIKDKTGNVPQITIGATAELVGANNGVGYYAGGYANNVIKGTVSGGAGIYAKAGEITIDGAHINALNSAYSAPVANGNGFTGGQGCAIVSDSNNGYAGSMNITIKAGSELNTNAAGGYTIKETLTNATQTKTESLVIEGGTFNGDIETTADLQANIVLNGTITGGTYSGDISSYLNGAEAVETAPGSGVYVVTVAVNVTVNAANFSTFSAKKAVVLPTGLTAYQAKSFENDALYLEKVAGPGETLAANCGVILYGANGKLVEGDDAGAKGVAANNYLRPATAWDANYAGVAYILHGSELWIYDGEEFPANKAFFLLQDPNGAPERVRLVFAAEDEATAIDNVEATVESVKFVENGQLFIRRGENIYNVQGQIVK